MNNEITFKDKDVLVMKLLHYFITQKGYNPIILKGVTNEIWLENMDSPYKIVRINTGYIHNKEQFDFDIFKTKKIMEKIKLRTFSFKMNALSLFFDLGESVKLESDNNVSCVNVKSEKDISKAKDIVNIFPDIKDKLTFNEKGVQLFTKITEDISAKNKKDSMEAEEVFKDKIPYVTYTLIAINIILFVLMYIFGKGSEDNITLMRFGALNTQFVVNYHEYYRIITSAFLHIGILHLVLNMYALYILGKDIETFYGKFKYLFIYIISATVGSLISILFISEQSISAGASGAIFGLMGALLYFGYHYRALLNNALTRQIIPVIVLNLAIGFMVSGINNFAHLGGLLGGFLAAVAVGVKYKSTKFEKINGIIALVILIAFLTYMIIK